MHRSAPHACGLGEGSRLGEDPGRGEGSGKGGEIQARGRDPGWRRDPIEIPAPVEPRSSQTWTRPLAGLNSSSLAATWPSPLAELHILLTSPARTRTAMCPSPPVGARPNFWGKPRERVERAERPLRRGVALSSRPQGIADPSNRADMNTHTRHVGLSVVKSRSCITNPPPTSPLHISAPKVVLVVLDHM